MALFVVLEDHTSGGRTLLAGKVINDQLYDTTQLTAAGAALVAYVPGSMDSILAAFRGTRRAKPAEPTGLTAMFAAAGLFSGGGPGAVTSVFGRAGAVVPVANDYNASEVFNDSTVVGADVAAALDTVDAELDVIEGLAGFMVPLYDLVTLLPIDVEITENAGNIVATLTDEAGALFVTGRWAGASYQIVTPATENLTAGTAAVPITNYLFLTEAAGVVTMGHNTTGFPADAIHLATVFGQSATEVAADGDPIGLHIYNDDPGEHIQHIGERIRAQHAEWVSGVLAAIAITTNGGVPDNVDVSTTLGTGFQMHKHTVQAFDTAITSEVYVTNDPTTPWGKVTDLNALLTDSTGASMSGRRFSITFAAIINQDTGESKLMGCLPSGSYNSDQGVIDDASKFAMFSIPSGLKGNAFLVAEAKLRHQTTGGGTWSVIELVDLRGMAPAQSGGGGAAQATEFDETVFRVFDGVDATKQIALEAGAIAPATTRTIIMADADITLTKDNRAGTVRPVTTNDDSEGYAVGSRWFDTTHLNAYVCLDATTGAAVWEAAHTENIHYERFPTSGDHWDGPAAAFLGSNDFIFAAWIRPEDIETYDGFTSTFSIVGNQSGTTGWRIGWNFGGIEVVVHDGLNIPFGPSNFGTIVGWGWSEVGDKESDMLVVGRVTGGAGTATLQLYLNGRRATVAGWTAANAGITASTGVLEMGGRGLYLHEGFAYLDGTVTDAELAAFMEASIKAGGIVEGGITWDSFFNSQDAPAAGVWNDQVGTDDLTDTGAPVEVSRRRRMGVLNTQ
jgi:hypothetical protein